MCIMSKTFQNDFKYLKPLYFIWTSSCSTKITFTTMITNKPIFSSKYCQLFWIVSGASSSFCIHDIKSFSSSWTFKSFVIKVLKKAIICKMNRQNMPMWYCLALLKWNRVHSVDYFRRSMDPSELVMAEKFSFAMSWFEIWGWLYSPFSKLLEKFLMTV